MLGDGTKRNKDEQELEEILEDIPTHFKSNKVILKDKL
jgi:hypothetical protein